MAQPQIKSTSTPVVIRPLTSFPSPRTPSHLTFLFLYSGGRPQSAASYAELDLLAEEALWRKKAERSQQQNSGNVSELQSKLDNQLKDAYKDISTYRTQAEQLSRDLRAERGRREKVERDLLGAQDDADSLRVDLADSRQENEQLSRLQAGGGNSDLISQLTEARLESERAYRERDRALDKVQDLEDECMRLEKLAGPAQKAGQMQREISELNSKKIEMMQDMIDEEARHLDEAGDKISGLEHERDEAMVQVARLQSLVKELRTDTRHSSRSTSRTGNSSGSPHGRRREEDWASRNAYATEALVQAALRMTQIETENERLRVP